MVLGGNNLCYGGEINTENINYHWLVLDTTIDYILLTYIIPFFCSSEAKCLLLPVQEGKPQ